jgi:hypothetical protein
VAVGFVIARAKVIEPNALGLRGALHGKPANGRIGDCVYAARCAADVFARLGKSLTDITIDVSKVQCNRIRF